MLKCKWKFSHPIYPRGNLHWIKILIVLGDITLVDYDNVELSNLHRQILHNESFIGMPKVMSAYNALTRYRNYVRSL